MQPFLEGNKHNFKWVENLIFEGSKNLTIVLYMLVRVYKIFSTTLDSTKDLHRYSLIFKIFKQNIVVNLKNQKSKIYGSSFSS